MKYYLTLACAVLFLAACGQINFQASNINPVTDISAPAIADSYEMYSWYAGDKWAFSIFDTATKVSTFADITQSEDTVIGTDEAIARLSQLPRGTKVYWNLKRIKGFALPDQKIMGKIVNALNKAGIEVEVIAWPL